MYAPEREKKGEGQTEGGGGRQRGGDRGGGERERKTETDGHADSIT